MAIKGFETITTPLNEADRRELAPAMVQLLCWRVGRSLALKNGELRAMMASRGFRVSDVKVRALINYIRTEGLLERLVASSDGYYVAENARELADYCDSLREREAAIRAVRQALEGQNTQSLF